MAKYREQPCIHYECKGKCDLGREADHKGLCQHCSTYKPRAKAIFGNKKYKANKFKYVE